LRKRLYANRNQQGGFGQNFTERKIMCQYQTLYQDDHKGYVVRCAMCKKIQIGFANLMLTFDDRDFDFFCNWLKRIKGEQHPSENETLRCIVIPTPCEGIKLLLSKRELNEFEEMLDIAVIELQSLALLKLFEEN
jgi:hypothetical protein